MNGRGQKGSRARARHHDSNSNRDRHEEYDGGRQQHLMVNFKWGMGWLTEEKGEIYIAS